MWMLVKDHLRRNWKLLFVGTLMLSWFFSLIVDLDANRAHGDSHSHWTILIAYSVLAYVVAESTSFKLVRIWRTLPLRECSLANLAWVIAVLAPPMLSLLIVLLTELLAFCFGKADSGLITWSFLFLPLATLYSGMLALVSALGRFEYARTAAARNPKRRQLSSNSHAPIFYLLVVCACALVLYLPSPWLGLGPSHLAGMCLAAGLTWKSYRMRLWLLQPTYGDEGRIHEAPGPESVPSYHGSAIAALAQDLRSTALETLLTLLFFAGFGYLAAFGLSWYGFLDHINWSIDSFTFVAIICVFVGFKSVIEALSHISMLGVVRSLPLTGNQCVLLLLSYPYAVSLAVIPCAAIPLWLAGQGRLPMLILAGILLCAGLCPFGMYILARFGRSSIRALIAFGMFFGIPGAFMVLPVFDERLTLTSTPVLCAGALMLVVLGAAGYFGLRRVVEGNSEIYKRKIDPE